MKNYRQLCEDAMLDDLNTPIVIPHLYDATRIINTVADGKATISEADLKELKEVFDLYLIDILGLQRCCRFAFGNQKTGEDKQRLGYK